MYLNCHTAFSFKYGTLTVKELFEEARRCDVHKLVMTEINNTASYIEMLRLCDEYAPYEDGLTKYGKTPYTLDIAVGVEFRKDNRLLYIAIAKNNDGFEEVNRFLSHHNIAGKALPQRAPRFDHVVVIYPFRHVEPETLLENEYIGVRKQDLTAYQLATGHEEYRHKCLAWHPVTVLDQKKDYNAHRLLRAIDNNTLLSKLPVEEQAQSDEVMMPEPVLAAHFGHHTALINNAKAVLDQCSLTLPLRTDKNKKYFTGSEARDLAYLEEETWKGFAQRYPVSTEELHSRIRKELDVIGRKNFAAYYLITLDLVRFARQRGFDFVGRGSGANSIVAYCLGITNVDPIELDLFFERFLNEERTSPPDFDIDFSWDNRDDIYGYLFKQYGPDRVCLLGTHVYYQGRSVVRELGKVFGLPKDEIDAIVEEPIKHRNRDHITELIFSYAEYITGKELPAGMSIHAGGVLITEKPIYAYTALAFPPKGYPVSHFEMHNAEDMGITKFDILSQRGLGHIKETVRLVKQNKGIEVNVHDFVSFKKDEKVKGLLRNSKAMGCFYVESPAMRMLLAKLRCEDYLTLVAASSIIRPGVASSGMMRTYIERYHAVRNNRTYEAIHPRMDELMKETYGVMVYQEDVIKVAHQFAGITLTEADVLRRGMSGKYRSREEFQRVRSRFFEECHKKGYPQSVIDRVWYEIESFSGYSFAKGHSASYAVESYQSLFLKAHYPLEFMVGVINNFGGFYKTEFYFHEARMNGGIIEAPCINRSEYLTTIAGAQIYIGFIHVKSLETSVAQNIPVERQKNGPYKSMSDFLTRITLGLEQARILIRIGALRFTGKNKQQLLWEAMLYFSQTRRKQPASELFDTEPKEYPLPKLERNGMEDAFDEIELLGFPLCDPFRLLKTAIRGDTHARALLQNVGNWVHIVGYLVTVKDANTRGGDHMNFGTFYDCQGEFFDTVHFPDTAKRYPLRGRGFYAIKGKVVEDFGVAMIEVSWMEKLPMINKRAEEFMRENQAASPSFRHP